MILSCVIILVILVNNNAGEVSTDWRRLSNHPSWKTLDLQFCGETSADRIIGGTNAAIGQFPWLVRLGYVVEGEDELDWLCGGTLITNEHVLTAAHCTAGENSAEYKLTWVRIGEYDINTNPDCQVGVCAPPVQDIGIKEVRTHEYFNNPNFHNDIAIIHLAAPPMLSAYVVPVCIPKQKESNQLRIGELVVVAGWGKMNISTNERASILQFVQVPILNNEVCNDLNADVFQICDKEICAGAQYNKDACGGDSGGPLMKVFDTDDGPRTFIIGVVSFGPTHCGIRKPAVYTSVEHYIEWILDNM